MERPNTDQVHEVIDGYERLSSAFVEIVIMAGSHTSSSGISRARYARNALTKLNAYVDELEAALKEGKT